MAFTVKQFGVEALNEAHETFLRLVKDGSAREDVGLNEFGEMAMQIDIQSEDAVIKHLRVFASAQKQGIRVVSEEHGHFTIGDNPQMTAFLDGFDGSSAFRDSNGKARGGTMFALYKGADPRFQDYLFGGIADHILGKIVVAVKGEGAHLIAGNKTSLVKVSAVETLDGNTRIDIDEGVRNYPTFPAHAQGYFYGSIKKSFKTRYVGSSAVYFFDLPIGDTDLVLEYGRKDNFEHMVAYPLVIESGGVMELVAGGDLGPTRYSEYCKMNNGYPAIIAASTPMLAEAARRYR